MADNWYLILELEFDPPVEDEKIIAARIDEKKKFWSSNFNNFKMGPQYRAWVTTIPQITKDMIGPDNIRRQLAADACTQIYGEVDKFLRIISRGDGAITSTEIGKMSKAKGFDEKIIRKRMKKLGIQEKKEVSDDYQKTFDQYYKTQPKGAPVFAGLDKMLGSFGVTTLYEFLALETTITDWQNQPCANLQSRAGELKKTKYYKHDPISATGAKLCSQCELTFKDNQNKGDYDTYLEYTRRKKILDDVKGVAEVSEELSVEQADMFIGQLTQLFKDRELAERVLTAFCKIQKIPCRSGAEEAPARQLKVCRCGCTNDVSNGRTVCKNCGLPLVIKCPKCGRENDANAKFCFKCSFEFKNLDAAVALCELAEHAIDALEFKAAEIHLKDAASYWKDCPKIPALEKRLKECQGRVGKEVAKMEEAIAHKRFVEAQKQYSTIHSLFPTYTNDAVRQQIEDAVTRARQLLSQARAAKAEKDILDLCARAYDVCADLPGVQDLIPAPAAVSGVKVQADSAMRVNLISWISAADSSIRYTVVRNTSGYIQHIADGEVVFRGVASSCTDQKIEPGVAYHYAVFAERAGTCSAVNKGGAVQAVNLFEIKNLSATAGNASLNLRWAKLPRNAVAEIYEIGPSHAERLVDTTDQESYLVTHLINGHSYQYRVRLSYQINGRKLKTAGMTVQGVPDSPPLPIDTLRVQAGQGDLFDATWLQEEIYEVRLFGSAKKPSYRSGDVLPLSKLMQEMTQLQKRPLSPQARQNLTKGETGAAFEYSGTTLMYVSAVVIKGSTAVFGSLGRATKGDNVKVSDVRLVNGQICIFAEAPKDATGFIVLSRQDHFPDDLSDVQSSRKYIPRKQYDLTRSILLDGVENRKFYFSVFAEFRRDGDKDYSPASNFLFDNSAKQTITYSVSVSKGFLGFGAKTINLEFRADSDEFELPALEVRSAVGNIPMFKSSSTYLQDIPAQHVKGSLHISIPVPGNLNRNGYIKPFLKDDADQSGNQLRLKVGSSYQIS